MDKTSLLACALVLLPALALAEEPNFSPGGFKFDQKKSASSGAVPMGTQVAAGSLCDSIFKDKGGPKLSRAQAESKLQAIGDGCNGVTPKSMGDLVTLNYDAEAQKLINAVCHAYYGFHEQVSSGSKLDKTFLEARYGFMKSPHGEDNTKMAFTLAAQGFWASLPASAVDYLGVLSGVPALTSWPCSGAGERVFDCNLNRKQDAGDGALSLTGGFVSKADGMTAGDYRLPLSAGGDFDSRYKKAVVCAAPQMTHIGWGQTGSCGSSSSCSAYTGNAAFFDLSQMGALVLLPGKKPSAALNDMFGAGSGKTKVECVSAMQILMYKSLMDTISPGGIDKLFDGQDFAVTAAFGTVVPAAIDAHLTWAGNAKKKADDAWLAAMKVGDMVYFRNSGALSPWAGENAIYLGSKGGERQYFAQGIGVVGEAKVYERLVAERDSNPAGADVDTDPLYPKGTPSAKRAPYLHQGYSRLKTSLASYAP